MNPTDYERSMAAATEETTRKPMRFGGMTLTPTFGVGTDTTAGYDVCDVRGVKVATCATYDIARDVAHALNLVPAVKDVVAAFNDRGTDRGRATLAFAIGRAEGIVNLINATSERRHANR